MENNTPPPEPNSPESVDKPEGVEPRPEQVSRREPFRPRRRRPSSDSNEGMEGQEQELTEKVVFINRSAKVVKGGRRFNFSALVVVGDKRGRVGIGLGKAGEVADAIHKGGEDAKQRMVNISLRDATIPHEVTSTYGGARILLR